MTDSNDKALESLADEIFELTTLSSRARIVQKPRQSPDLGESEFLALDLLKKGEPRTVGEIQKSIGVLPAQMSRVMRSLESKHGPPLIDCTINPKDKRCIDVRLTDSGRQTYDNYRAARLAASVAVLSELSSGDRREFMRILRLIRDTIAKQLSMNDLQRVGDASDKFQSGELTSHVKGVSG